MPGGLSASTAWLGAVALSCLSLACARTSDERMLAISQLLEEAERFGAQVYVPDALKDAEGLLAEARTELAARRPWRFGTRKRASTLLRDCEIAAIRVRAAAAAAAARARQDAGRAVTDAHTALDQASQTYWRAPRGKDTRIDLLRMRADLDGLLRVLTEAEVAQERGDFLLTIRLATQVERESGEVARTIERAMEYRLVENAPRAGFRPGALGPRSQALSRPRLGAS